MATTVSNGFAYFRENFVDLDKDETAKSKSSRGNLKDQIADIASKDLYFPPFTNSYMPFGSFARKTKIQPLNDIDMLIFMSGNGLTASYSYAYTDNITVSDTSSAWYRYTNDTDMNVNSTRVLNKIRDSLSKVSSYQKADVIKRNHVAVVLKLASYPWSFDVVPAIPVSNGAGGVDYYLIPDGAGKWTRTDPRRDQKAITDANQYHQGNLIPLIRIMKYWNDRYYDVPKLNSYYLETMLIKGFGIYSAMTGIRWNIPNAFRILASSIMATCLDPKWLGPNLDEGLLWETRNKISTVCTRIAGFAESALNDERNGNHKSAIEWWHIIFHDFPEYG